MSKVSENVHKLRFSSISGEYLKVDGVAMHDVADDVGN